MSTQTGSISFESAKGLHSIAKQNFSTLSQVLGQFAVCETGASVANKKATIIPEDANWTLQDGTIVTVTFSNTNTQTTPTLNVNETGAKEIRDIDGNALTKAAREWPEGAAIALIYDQSLNNGNGAWKIQDSNLMKRVHTAETAIEQTANNVLIKATENDITAAQGGQHLIESFINVAPSGVTISADKVNIEGAAIFTNGRLSENSLNNYATKDDLADVSSGAELTKSMSGERTIITEDAANLPLLTLDPVYSESVQDGTPTPDAPKKIFCVKSPNILNGENATASFIESTDSFEFSGWASVLWSKTFLSTVLETGQTYFLTFTATCIAIPDSSYTYKENRDTPVLINQGVGTYLKGVATSVLANNIGVPYEFVIRYTYNGSWGGTQEYYGLSGYTALFKDSSNRIAYATFKIENIQLSRADSATTCIPKGYAPYGSIGVVARNKNFLSPSNTATSGLSWTVDNDGRINVSGTATNAGWKAIWIGTLSPGTYTYSCSGTVALKLLKGYTDVGYAGTITVTSETDVYRLSLNTAANTVYSGYAYAQLERGSTATTYEPYQEHVSYIDLKGNELYGLDETYRDILRIDANGHAVIEKRTGKKVFDGSENWSNQGSGMSLLRTVYLPECEASQTNSKFKSNLSPVNTGTNYVNFNSGGSDVASWKSILSATNAVLIHYLPESEWHTIDLGYVSLPKVTDGSTIHVAAEIQPVIGGSWWTKAGESVGQLAQQNKNSQGTLEAPYTEVEWVESDGKQFIQLDWIPKSGFGFDVEFMLRGNTFGGAGSGIIFGCRDGASSPETGTNRILSTWTDGGQNGTLRIPNSNTGYANINAGMYTDGRKQTCSLHGTTYTKPDKTTVTVTNAGVSPTWGMTIFAGSNMKVRPQSYGSLEYWAKVRIYSLKFYDGDTLAVDLVGAIRNSDNTPGLYDKVAKKFWVCRGLTYGDSIKIFGTPETLAEKVIKSNVNLTDGRTANSRLWIADAPVLERLEDGQQITIRTQWTNANEAKSTELAGWQDSGTSTQCYLKLNFTNGDSGWIPMYYGGTTRLTGHYGAGQDVHLTYRENVTLSGGYPVSRGWWCDANYTDGNQTYDKYSDSVIAGKNGIKRYTLCMKDDQGNWTSIVNQANNYAVSGKTCYTGGLQLGKILYAVGGADYAAGANSGVMAQTYPGFDFRYSVNGVQNAAATELQLRKPIYLVGELDEDTGLFYLNTTKWWTQTEPTTEDGKIYILIGSAYGSYYAAFLAAKNPTYKFIKSKFQNLEDLAVQETHKIYYRTTATSNKPSAGPSTWITTATNIYNDWTTKVPPLANGTDSSVSGYTKYPFLYTCEQRRLANNTIECTDITLDENTTVIDGGTIVTNSIAANTIRADSGTFNTANIPNLSAAKITSGDIAADRIKTNAVSAINATANKIDAKNINVSQIQIGQSQVTDLESDMVDAKKHTQVIISAANVNYIATGNATAASLTATLYIDGAATTSNVTYQWSKDGTAISGATSQTLTVTGTMGLAHRYSCKCGF